MSYSLARHSATLPVHSSLSHALTLPLQKVKRPALTFPSSGLFRPSFLTNQSDGRRPQCDRGSGQGGAGAVQEEVQGQDGGARDPRGAYRPSRVIILLLMSM